MSFSYSPSLSTDKDKARFLMGDRLEASAVFADEEINGMINMQGNLFLAVALLAWNRASELISVGIQYTIGSGVRDAVSVDRRSIPKYWQDLARKMEMLATSLDIAEAFDRFAYDIGADGRDYSDYQGFN